MLSLLMVVGLVVPAFILGLAAREATPSKVRCRRMY
jgi:hypothetical protein